MRANKGWQSALSILPSSLLLGQPISLHWLHPPPTAMSKEKSPVVRLDEALRGMGDHKRKAKSWVNKINAHTNYVEKVCSEIYTLGAAVEGDHPNTAEEFLEWVRRIRSVQVGPAPNLPLGFCGLRLNPGIA